MVIAEQMELGVKLQVRHFHNAMLIVKINIAHNVPGLCGMQMVIAI